jgi:DNA replicative helicase MCM subunit Mcm2 (Cdc46/Mcm family)
MKTDLLIIRESLAGILSASVPPLRITKNSDSVFEVTCTKEAMQGKKKVDGIYFASVVPKPADVRFYFFPIYTHVKAYEKLSNELKKCLKGKSCFHIKKLSPELEKEIDAMVKKGISLYKKENWI